MADVGVPTIRDLRAYLRFRGWTEHPPGPVGALWTKDGARIGVPGDPDPDLIASVITRLAVAENKSKAALTSSVKYLFFDVAHLRAANDYLIADAIPLQTGARILSSARTMFRATATTARSERPHIGASYSKIGDEVVRKVLMGHTEQGSYVIPVLMPIPEPPETDLHQPTLDHDRPEFHRSPSEPYERRIVRTFAQSMQAVRELVVEPARVPRRNEIHELVYRGVSREFCSALAGILKQQSIAAFQASVTWAPAVPAPATMPRSITIESEAVDLVKQAAESMRQQKVEGSRVFSGTIVQLRHESQDDPFGEVAISTMRQGQQGEVLVRLPMNLYRDAWEWHYQGRAVLVEGTIRRSPGRPNRVDLPTRFHPVDLIMLETPSNPRPLPVQRETQRRQLEE